MAGKIREMMNKLLRLQATTVEQRRQEVRQELTEGDALIDGQKYPLQDWSASGYAVGPCNLEPSIGARIEIEFHVPLPAQELVFKTPCLTVRRIEAEGLIGGTYLGVDPESRKIIDEHFQILTSESFRQEVETGLRDAAERITKRK